MAPEQEEVEVGANVKLQAEVARLSAELEALQAALLKQQRVQHPSHQAAMPAQLHTVPEVLCVAHPRKA